MNYIRNACVSPELDVHEKLHYTGDILDEYVRRRAFNDIRIEVRSFVVPVRIFVYDEFVKLYGVNYEDRRHWN